jgi:hypothetical protein
MGRSQFTFYESFHKALDRIKKKADKADAYDAICRYALYGEVPDLDNLPDAAAIAFELIRPTLDASKRKAEAGSKGGKQNGSKTEANRKRGETATEKEDEKEKENEYEYERERENECYSATLAPFEAPSLDEVQEFCQAEKLNIDPSRFFNYYEGRGWMLGSQPMVNWKAVLKSWGDDKTKTGSGGTIGTWTSESMRDLAQEVQRRRAQRDLDPMTKRAVERMLNRTEVTE